MKAAAVAAAEKASRKFHETEEYEGTLFRNLRKQNTDL